MLSHNSAGVYRAHLSVLVTLAARLRSRTQLFFIEVHLISPPLVELPDRLMVAVDVFLTYSPLYRSRQS